MHTSTPTTQAPLAESLRVSDGPCPLEHKLTRRRGAGFSLIEVTLAIAIVAFAFIALIGLLPAGLGIFNQTMDSTNEMRISNDLSSMVQAAYYEKLDTDFANNIFYFDVDGALLDSKQDPKGYEDERIYCAKVVVDRQQILPSNITLDQKMHGLRVILLIGKYNPIVEGKLETTKTAGDVDALLKKPIPNHKIRVFPMLIAKNDSFQSLL